MVVQVDRTKNFTVEIRRNINISQSVLLVFTYGDETNATVMPVKYIDVIPNMLIENRSNVGSVVGRAPGKVIVGATSEHISIPPNDIMIVNICKSYALDIFCIVVGWIYFVVWSVSFYPQIWMNFRRKSVVGLSFDFLALNVLGFTCLTIFDVALYCFSGIQKIYFAKYPRSLNPVALNDVIFAAHALATCLITALQCFIYERGGQKITKFGIVTLIILIAFTVISIIVTIAKGIDALMLLYLFSYVKLATTLIKYIPQVFMNYKRKSTVGWSIGNILLDFTGGLASLLQQILSAHNYNDINFVVGNPVKFGLSLASMGFDIIFIFQHYVLYRQAAVEVAQDQKKDDGI